MNHLKENKIIKSLYNYFSTYFVKTKNTKKNSIHYTIEPLSCIIRLAILSFREDGTKISISNNRIHLQNPSVLQGTARWASGDTRTDLSYLLYPIKKATEWYSHKNKDIDILFKRAILGLTKLKESYNKQLNIVCHSIDLYISIIKDSLKNKNRDYIEDDSEDDSEDLNNSDEDEKLLYLKLKELWHKEQIKLIIQLVSHMEKDNENRSNYISAIDNILNIIEEKMSDTVQNLHIYS